jgi:hypothetical protein
MSASVEGFGCRPLTGVRHIPAAGGRKPPKDETAMGSGWRWRGHYGDLAAAAEEVGCRRGDGSQRWLALRMRDRLVVAVFAVFEWIKR